MVCNVSDSDKRRVFQLEDLPVKITKLENVVIPMKDGAKLYPHIWIPESYDQLNGDDRVPGILEYLPYGKNDFTAIRDSIRHPYWAGHGYASIRVDMRGCGDWDESLPDEYLKQEQDGCLDVFDGSLTSHGVRRFQWTSGGCSSASCSQNCHQLVLHGRSIFWRCSLSGRRAAGIWYVVVGVYDVCVQC